ncbi:MAG: hypothetical protein OEW06_17165 [Gemmatimonadota bacterium]|nr:hypothetical protein [Gemmatimonadota bacterium]
MTPRSRSLIGLFALLASTSTTAATQQPSSSRFAELHWRAVGPFRGGRTKAITGVPGQPHVFYVGVVNGGVSIGSCDRPGCRRSWRPADSEAIGGHLSSGWG